MLISSLIARVIASQHILLHKSSALEHRVIGNLAVNNGAAVRVGMRFGRVGRPPGNYVKTSKQIGTVKALAVPK